MTSEDGPGGRVFGIDDQRAGGLEQVGGAVQHGARRLEDGLLGGGALGEIKKETQVCRASGGLSVTDASAGRGRTSRLI